MIWLWNYFKNVRKINQKSISYHFFKKGIHLTRTHHAKEHANLLSTALCNLGEVYRHKQMLPEAKIVIEEAIIIKEKLYGGNNGETTNVEVATTLDGLGNLKFINYFK